MIRNQAALIALIPFALSAQESSHSFWSRVSTAVTTSSPFQQLSVGTGALASLAVKGLKDGALLCKAGKPGAAYAVLSGKLAALGAFGLGSNAYTAYNAETDRTFVQNVAQGTALTTASVLMPRGKTLSPAAQHSFIRHGINGLKRTALGSSKLALFGLGVNAFSQGAVADEARTAYTFAKPYAVKAFDAAKNVVQKIDCDNLQ